jgi:prepilin-type N-terminal cleavage/methylation domain-containing protein
MKPMNAHAPVPRKCRGFTLVELMAVIAITVIGFLAVLHLQQSVIRASSNVWNMLGASQFANHILQTIRMESVEWYNDSGTGEGGALNPRFRFLRHAGAPAVGATSGWRTPDFFDGAPAFAMVNQIGRTVAYDAGALQAVRPDRNQRYCARYRLTWLVPNVLIRAEARILWTRDDAPAGLYDDCNVAMDNRTADAFSITMPMTVMKNVFVAP